MPKLAISKYEERCRHVRGVISKAKEIKKLSDKDLAKAIGKNPRFMEQRDADPGSLRLSELWAICDKLGIPPAERLEILGVTEGRTT